MTHLLVFIFIFSLLNCIRHGFFFYKRLTAENLKPFKMGVVELIILGITISIVITCLICGFKI